MTSLLHRGYFSLSPLVIIASLLSIGATISLGNWQVRRGEQKELLQQRILGALHEAPIALKEPLPAPDSLLYQPVEMRGTWRADQVVYLDNRPNEGRVGLYVLMPLQLAGGTVVMVNRGWLPRDPLARAHIEPYQTPAGEVAVKGIAIALEPSFLNLGHHVAGRTGEIWQNFAFDEYRAASGLAPVPIIVREDQAGKDGLLRNWPDRDSAIEGQIERHHGYAFQWYAMAVALAALTLFYGIRNARRKR